MALINSFLQKKNTQAILIGVLLIVYLYFDTPLPFHLVLQKLYLVIAIFVSLIVLTYLCIKVNIFVGIIFAIVAFEVIKKSLRQTPENLDRKVNFYSNTETNSNVVISENLKDSNTLEQEIVKNMASVVSNDPPGQTPRYQPLVADIAGSSQIE